MSDEEVWHGTFKEKLNKWIADKGEEALRNSQDKEEKKILRSMLTERPETVYANCQRNPEYKKICYRELKI